MGRAIGEVATCGKRMHGPMSGASEWGFISLAPEYLAACGKVLSRVKLSIDRMSAGFCRMVATPSNALQTIIRSHASLSIGLWSNNARNV
jgi:hypothetical protein